MAIKNGKSRETGNIGHKRHRNEDKQSKKQKPHITKTLTNTIPCKTLGWTKTPL